MIKFTYKVKNGKADSCDPGTKFIYWKCTWDGKHNQKCFEGGSEFHPFSGTFEFRDSLDLYQRYLTAFKKQKKKRVSIYSKKKHKGTLLGEDKGLTREEIETLNPEHLRKMEDVVAYNPVTLALCKMLADMDNVHKHSGWTHPYSYWKNLLGCLVKLWD